MTHPNSSPREKLTGETAIRRNLRLSFAAGAIVTLIGLLALAGWQWHLTAWKSVSPGWVPMKVNTALGMIACGATLMLLSAASISSVRRRLATLLAKTVIVMSALTLAEHFFDLDLGIDQFWFPDPAALPATSPPGRMVPATAFCFVLAGCALLAGAWPIIGRMRMPTINIAALALALIGGFALCGHAVMPINTAVGFILLGAGLLALVRAGDGLIWSLNRWTSGGMVMGVILLLVAAGISYNLIVQLQSTARQVDHRQQVLRKIQEISTGLATLESDQRGELITGDDRWLTEREELKTATREELRLIQELTADNPTQQDRLKKLDSLVAECIAWEDRMIAIRRADGYAAAGRMVTKEMDTDLLDAIEGLLKEARDKEYALLIVGQKQSDRAVEAAFLLLPLGVFFSLTMLLLGSTFLNSGTGKRREAEEALRTSEVRYRRLFETAKDGILILDAKTGMVVDVNPFLIATLGFSYEQFLGKTIWELGFFKDVIANEAKFAELRDKEYIRYENLPLETIDGKKIEVEFVSNVYLVDGDKVIQCNVRDTTERRKAEEAMRLRESALKQVSQGVLICDENRLITYANAGFSKITGYEESELLGRSCALLQGPESDPETIKKIRTALEAGEAFEGEILNYRRDGRSFWNDLSIAPIPGEPGRPLRFIGIQRDVSERKHAEVALTESQGLYQSLFENMVEGYAYCRFLPDEGGSPDFVYLEVNSAFVALTGLKNVTGKRVSEVIPGIQENDRELLELYERVASDGRPERREIYLKSLDVWFSISVYSPAKEHFVAMFDNITERKQAELEVSFNAQRYRSLVEATAAIVWNTPASGEFEEPQPLWTAFTGQNFEEMRGRGWLNAVHPEDRAETVRAWTAAYDSRTIYETEHRLLRANDHTYRNMLVRAVPILAKDSSTMVRQWVGMHTDITRQRRAEATLAAALAQEKELSEKARAGDQAKSEFLAVMSHEIRTPLNGILGFSELLAQTRGLPQQSKDYVQTIISSGEALLRILNDVLDFSRLEAGHVQIEKIRFTPCELLGDIRALLAQQARDKQLTFGVSLAGNIPKFLEGDVGRLRQILLNLVGNAIKFTEQGSVTLGLRAGDGVGHYEFFVKDTGSGITPEQIKRLFQPFTQADSSISRRHGGTGLGLSISRHLAELLGGTLTTRSESSQGSEFILTIALGEPAPAMEATPETPPETLDANFARQHPLRVLVVEDDKVNLKLILSLVRRLGYEPLAAKNGREAVDMQQSERPDCMLMDMQMPEMDGIEATEKIRAEEKISLPVTPVFIFALTANIFPADRQRCLDAGMNGYLNKPVKLSALAAMLVEAGDFMAPPA